MRLGRLIIFHLLLTGCCFQLWGAPPIVDSWKYTLRKPKPGWEQLAFDDASWMKGAGGFGTRETPAARLGTIWNTNHIWLRKSFSLKEIPSKPALLIHHDEDTEVYLNGTLIAQLKGFTVKYQVISLKEKERSALRKGDNFLAVHCHQSVGGQFIDVHLIDATQIPELPKGELNRKPYSSKLITRWGKNVTKENAWREYPRPQLRRDNWLNLNGEWDYAITKRTKKEVPMKWSGTILVPFCLESKLGGVQRLLSSAEALWYRRSFHLADTVGHRTLLNFEAVDYRCEVFVNGQSVGTHQGGNTPFALDMTNAVKPGRNKLVVRVEDETEEWQLRGKQTRNPRGIWYTQVSGIWQTVWLEQVSKTYLQNVKLSSNAKEGSITIRPEIAGDNRNVRLKITVKDAGKTVQTQTAGIEGCTMTIPNAKLWSPKAPHLYQLSLTLLDEENRELDSVESYTGIRTVGKMLDSDGHWKFTLNGKELFHWGPLDQGWWPDGLLTPPSDEAMLFDIRFLQDAGFNMIRKHIKTEPRRYYYHCDRLGMMLWQDHVSGGQTPSWTRLRVNPSDADWPEEHHSQFMHELDQMIDTLENHPSIVVWVPFNEAWGQHRTLEVGHWVAKRDASRLVNIASGGNFWPVGDIVDHHHYPHPDFPFDEKRYAKFIKVIGEFGGHGFPVKDHLWDEDRRNWGYGGLPKNKEEYKSRYVQSIQMLKKFQSQGIAGGIYTQTTDVEGEINGLITYDRNVIKIPAKELQELHRKLFSE